MIDAPFKSVSILYEGENLGTVAVEQVYEFLKDLTTSGKIPADREPGAIELSFHTV
jgi:hypothetical protein